jgi:site-specific recombinase XerC
VSAAGLPSLVQRFFTQRLLEQQGLSSHTVASYRDTFRLLLAFATKHIGRAPSKLQIEDFDVSYGHAIRGLPLCMPSSGSSRSASLRCFCSVSASLQFHLNAANTALSSFSPRAKPQLWSGRLMYGRGSAGATERCFW